MGHRKVCPRVCPLDGPGNCPKGCPLSNPLDARGVASPLGLMPNLEFALSRSWGLWLRRWNGVRVRAASVIMLQPTA
jgi:hypothetical protein